MPDSECHSLGPLISVGKDPASYPRIRGDLSALAYRPETKPCDTNRPSSVFIYLTHRRVHDSFSPPRLKIPSMVLMDLAAAPVHRGINGALDPNRDAQTPLSCGFPSRGRAHRATWKALAWSLLSATQLLSSASTSKRTRTVWFTNNSHRQ